jgi:hypothetical protein
MKPTKTGDEETLMVSGVQTASVPEIIPTFANGGKGLRSLQAATTEPTPAPTTAPEPPPPGFNPTIGFLIIVFGWFGLLGGGVCIWKKYCKRGNGVTPN